MDNTHAGDMGLQELGDEESDFISLRSEIFLLLLEISMKIESYDEIVLDLLENTKSLLKNEDGYDQARLEFKVEATLASLVHFLRHSKPPEKFHDFPNVSQEMRNYFLNEEIQNIFMHEEISSIVTIVYIECVLMIKNLFVQDSDKSDL